MFFTLQKIVNYMRQSQEMVLFASMLDVKLAVVFRTSLAFYMILPLMGILLTITAFIHGYQLIRANNQNFDRWFLFISSLLCAILASVSFYGISIAFAIGLTFAIAPWFFLSALVLALSYHLVMLVLDCYRAYESSNESSQRVHYVQASLAHAFSILLLITGIAAVSLVLLSPVSSIVGSVFAGFAVILTVLDITWRVLPTNWKQIIKGWFHLSKPDVAQDATLHLQQEQNIICEKNTYHSEPIHHRLFTHCDYRALICHMEKEEAEVYLSQRIQYKLNQLAKEPPTKKTVDKMALLKELVYVLQEPNPMSKKDLLQKYPLAFQSFWAEKGEIEQLFDAVEGFLDNYSHKPQFEYFMR